MKFLGKGAYEMCVWEGEGRELQAVLGQGVKFKCGKNHLGSSGKSFNSQEEPLSLERWVLFPEQHHSRNDSPKRESQGTV